MKKKVISVLLTATMLAGLLAGCGSNGDTAPAADNAEIGRASCRERVSDNV